MTSGGSRRRGEKKSIDPLVESILLQRADESDARRLRREPTEPPIRVLIVDAQRIVRLGLNSLFSTARCCQVIADVGTAAEAVDESHRQRPDVVVLDADLPGGAAIDACAQLRAVHPETRVIMLAEAANPRTISDAIHAGCGGYLLNATAPARLIDAVETAAAGGVYFEEAVSRSVLEWLDSGRPTGQARTRLSERERRILGLIAEGETNRAIATALGLSEHTVKTYVSSLLKKLGLASRAEAAAFSVRGELE